MDWFYQLFLVYIVIHFETQPSHISLKGSLFQLGYLFLTSLNQFLAFFIMFGTNVVICLGFPAQYLVFSERGVFLNQHLTVRYS